MRKVIGLFSAALLTLAIAAPVAADADEQFGVEFGPEIPGNTFANVTGDGVVIKLQFTRPNQDLYYEVWCGPFHYNAGALAATGTFTTNGKGNGNTGNIPFECAGSGTGHVDVGGFSSTNRELTAQFTY